MAEYLSPGVYVEEFDSGVKAMEGVGTSTAGFVGLAEKGPVTGRPVLLTSFAEYQRRFGGYLSELEYGKYRYLPNAVEQFFTNGGSTCYVMRAAPEDAACAKSAEGPVVVQAKNPGAWANTMQVFFSRSTRARTQILEAQDGVGGKQYRLKNAAGFRVGDLAAYRTEGAVAYFKVTALNGMLVSFHTELPEDAVDTALVPARTLEACGVDMVIRCGGQEENYPGCSLNPAAPDYLLAALEKSTMASMTLHLPEDAGDPLSLLGAGPDAENLRIELSGGLNGTMDSVNAGTFNGADLGPGKRSGIEAFQGTPGGPRRHRRQRTGQADCPLRGAGQPLCRAGRTAGLHSGGRAEPTPQRLRHLLRSPLRSLGTGLRSPAEAPHLPSAFRLYVRHLCPHRYPEGRIQGSRQ